MSNPRFRHAAVALLALFALASCTGKYGAISPAYAASAPLWPTGAVLQLNQSTPTTLNLSWPVPSADPGTTVMNYEISVDGVVRATLPAMQTNFQLTDLAPATTYGIAVRARDGNSLVSASLSRSLRTAETTVALVEQRTILQNGVNRTYRLDIPAGYTGDNSTRLVIGLHGGGGTPNGFAYYTQLPTAAAMHGWVVAYPEGTAGLSGLRTWNGGGCCGEAVTTQVDDVGFLSALRSEIGARFHISTTALTGHSNGAIMAYRFACERAGEVDGIGVYAGTLFKSPCAPYQARVPVAYPRPTGYQPAYFRRAGHWHIRRDVPARHAGHRVVPERQRMR